MFDDDDALDALEHGAAVTRTTKPTLQTSALLTPDMPRVTMRGMPLALSGFNYAESRSFMMLVTGLANGSSPSLLATGPDERDVYAFPALKLAEENQVVAHTTPVYYGFDKMAETRADVALRNFSMRTVPALKVGVKMKDGARQRTAYLADIQQKTAAIQWDEGGGGSPAQVGLDRIPLAALQTQADALLRDTSAPALKGALARGLAPPADARALAAAEGYSLDMTQMGGTAAPSRAFSRYVLPINMPGGAQLVKLEASGTKLNMELEYKGETVKLSAWRSTIAAAYGRATPALQDNRMKVPALFYVHSVPGATGVEHDVVAVTPFYSSDKPKESIIAPDNHVRLASNAVRGRLQAILAHAGSDPEDKSKPPTGKVLTAEDARRVEFAKTVGPLPLQLMPPTGLDRGLEVGLVWKLLFKKAMPGQPAEELVAQLCEYDAACVAAETGEMGYATLPEVPERLALLFDALQKGSVLMFTGLFTFAMRKQAAGAAGATGATGATAGTHTTTLIEYADADGIAEAKRQLGALVAVEGCGERERERAAFFHTFLQEVSDNYEPDVVDGPLGVRCRRLRCVYDYKASFGRRYTMNTKILHDPFKDEPRAICLQGSPRELRPFLCGRLARDYDLKNAQPQLLRQLAAQLEWDTPRTPPALPELEDWCVDRDAFIEHVAEVHGLAEDAVRWPEYRKEAVKNLMISLVFGGTYEQWLGRYSLDTAADAPRSPKILKLQRELAALREAVFASRRWAPHVAEQRERLRREGEKTEDGIERSIFALIAQSEEDRILQAMCRSADAQGFTVMSLQYDGFFVCERPGHTLNLVALKERIQCDTGYDMDVVEKPLHLSGGWPMLSLKRAAGGGTKKGKKRASQAPAKKKAKEAKTAPAPAASAASRSDDDSTSSFTVAASPKKKASTVEEEE